MKHRFLITWSFTFLTFITILGKEKLIIVNEGLWQCDNGSLSYFEDEKVVSNHWFRDVNGYKLGDTPNDILQINESLIAIAINWSNIVQFISPDGKAIAATEDVPNNRKLATDGRYVYISSYGHECGTPSGFLEFEKGYVAKIDTEDFQVVTATEVGYEPEGIAFYKRYLFVANTGGYAFQEDHDYESSVTVIDAESMEVVRTIDTKQINLYGKMSQSGRYLCINSPGDYYYIPAATVIFDCQCAIDGKEDEDCLITLPYAATYNTTDSEGNFYAIGSRYSYLTGKYTFNYVVINPYEVIQSKGETGISEEMPGTILKDLQSIQMPYGIFINPFTKHFYATDAGSFTAAGALLHWDPEGNLISTNQLYINPAHFLALPSDGENDAIDIINIKQNTLNDKIYNIIGQPVKNICKGDLYIKNRKKFIAQ